MIDLNKLVNRTREKLINFKVSREEYIQMKEKAMQYTNGNVSGWIRFSSTNWDIPREKLREFEKDIKRLD